jgi:flagellar biosynthesis anti-sigma factor FlgM
MKVGNDNKTSALDSLIKSAQPKSSKGKGLDGAVDASTTDRVELSSRKEEIQRLTDRVKAAPVVRQDKVDQMKEALAAQTYNVKGELVARSILKSQLLDQVL